MSGLSTRFEIVCRSTAALISAGLGIWGVLLFAYSFAPWFQWMPSLNPANWPESFGWFIALIRDDPIKVVFCLLLMGWLLGTVAKHGDPRKDSGWTTLAQFAAFSCGCALMIVYFGNAFRVL